MRIVVTSRRPTLWTIYKTCMFCCAGYVLAVFCLAGLAALFGKLHIDPNLGYGDLIVMVLSPVLAPVVLGFALAVPGWALWALYARFRKSPIVIHVDSLDSASEEPIQPPENNARDVT